MVEAKIKASCRFGCRAGCRSGCRVKIPKALILRHFSLSDNHDNQYYKEKGNSKKIVLPDKEKRLSDVRYQTFPCSGFFSFKEELHDTEHRHSNKENVNLAGTFNMRLGTYDMLQHCHESHLPLLLRLYLNSKVQRYRIEFHPAWFWNEYRLYENSGQSDLSCFRFFKIQRSVFVIPGYQQLLHIESLFFLPTPFCVCTRIR